jgi:CRISPR-associated endonuclease Cas1
MAATQTVPQSPHFLKSPDRMETWLAPRHGVVTLFGYGIKVFVDRGHLVFEDGIGSDRHRARLPRVGHGLRRLVVIGADGFVSLAALRWLADQDTPFVMLERDGKVLAATGPVGPSDARLRRSQALARDTRLGVDIARELISQKLAAQEQIARDRLNSANVADAIAASRVNLASADNVEAIRFLEAQAAHAYWSAWRAVQIVFPKADLRRVPEHWCLFGMRKSPISGSPRLAANPPNAMLNYLYAVLESEARLAAVALGLDPGVGFLHADTDARDSLACDLMEPIRPQIDAYVLDWIRRQPFRREWFFEKRDGNCRLMAQLCLRLSETTQTWGALVAPVAEWVSRKLWSTVRNSGRQKGPATHLTQAHRRDAKGEGFRLPMPPAPQPPRVCPGCGATVEAGKIHCAPCAIAMRRQAMAQVAAQGRITSHTAEAELKRGAAQRAQREAERKWRTWSHPAWLTDQFYTERIQPRLDGLEVKALAASLGVSIPYASSIRAGRREPHPRHWETLARLVGVALDA